MKQTKLFVLFIMATVLISLFSFAASANELTLPTFSPTGISGSSWNVEKDEYNRHYITFTTKEGLTYNRIPFFSAGKLIIKNMESSGVYNIKASPIYDVFILNSAQSTHIFRYAGVTYNPTDSNIKVTFIDLTSSVSPSARETTATKTANYGENGIIATGDFVVEGIPHLFEVAFTYANGVVSGASLAIDQNGIDQNGDGKIGNEKINIITQDGTILDLDEIVAKIKGVAPTQSTNQCTDSDGGKDYFVYGTATGITTWSNEFMKMRDYCSWSTNNPSEQSLAEFYCNEEGKVASERKDCQCANGACVSVGSTQSPTSSQEPTVLKGTFSLQGQELRLFVTVLSTNYPIFILVSKDSINKVRAEKVGDDIYESKWIYKEITYKVQLNARHKVATISTDVGREALFDLKEISERLANEEIYTSQTQQYIQQRYYGRCDAKEVIDVKSPAVQCLEKVFDKNRYDYDNELMRKCDDRVFRQMPEFAGCDDNHMVPITINCIRQAKPDINKEIDACLQLSTTFPRPQPVTSLPPVPTPATDGAGSFPKVLIENSFGNYKYLDSTFRQSVEIKIPEQTGYTYHARYTTPKNERIRAAVVFYTPGTDLANNLAIGNYLNKNIKEGYTTKVLQGHTIYTTLQPNERWAVWTSGDKIIVVGNDDSPELPEELVLAYLDRYPSDISSGIKLATPIVVSSEPRCEARGSLKLTDEQEKCLAEELTGEERSRIDDECDDPLYRTRAFDTCTDAQRLFETVQCAQKLFPQVKDRLNRCIGTTIQPVPPTTMPISPDVEQRIQAIERELKEQRTILQKIMDFFSRLFGG